MRALTSAEVETLASRERVRRVAVENFLSTLPDLSKFEHYHNLAQDALSYGWNRQTIEAIRDGIRLATLKGKGAA